MAAAKKKSTSSGISIDDSWRIEDDLRCLLEAAKIKRDPKRMAAVRKLAQQKTADMQALKQI